jgi:glycine betaine/proline transport system permease protein
MNESTTSNGAKHAVLERMSPRRRRLAIVAVSLLVVATASAALQAVNPTLPDLHIADAVDASVRWLRTNFDWFLDALRTVVVRLLVSIEAVFLYVPWIVWVVGVGLFSYRLIGWKSGVVFGAGLSLIVSFGLWENAISTLAVVATSMVFILVTAIPLGIFAARNDRFESLIRPVLDAMQTIPTLVYLVPIVFLLSAGKMPAVVASMIYAVPPAIRLTNLALRQVSPETKEAARSFGVTQWQMLFKVELPLAMPTIMAGVNQSTMMAFAMVIIGALVGAGGLGNDVLFAMSRVRVGDGFEAGVAILVLAIILDRITQTFGARGKDPTLL